MSKQIEAATIREVIECNTDAFGVLVERYHRGLCIYLFNMLKDEMVAEDIAQDAFVRAYQKLDKFNPEYSFSTWLYRIARNLGLRHIDKNKQHYAAYDVTEIEDNTAESAQKVVEKAEQTITIEDAITKLKPEYQDVINLYYWNEKSYEEISEIMEAPVGTIRTWLHRSKNDIRKELYGQIG